MTFSLKNSMSVSKMRILRLEFKFQNNLSVGSQSTFSFLGST